jgi:rare lipoprotein A
MTAAHRTLPLPSVVLVENLENGRKIKLLLNDRGPFAKTQDRIIDVSQRAAELLGFRANGYAKVRVVCLPKESRIAAIKYRRRPYPAKL